MAHSIKKSALGYSYLTGWQASQLDLGKPSTRVTQIQVRQKATCVASCAHGAAAFGGDLATAAVRLVSRSSLKTGLTRTIFFPVSTTNNKDYRKKLLAFYSQCLSSHQQKAPIARPQVPSRSTTMKCPTSKVVRGLYGPKKQTAMTARRRSRVDCRLKNHRCPRIRFRLQLATWKPSNYCRNMQDLLRPRAKSAMPDWSP